MKKIFTFLKAAIFDGFLVILPVTLVILILGEIMDLIMMLTEPVEKLLPVNTLGGIDVAILLAIIIILSIFFLAGLTARTKLGGKMGKWFENTIFMKLPGYNILKSFSDRLIGVESDGRFIPALLITESETKLPVLIVEELEDESTMIFVPMTPTPGVGTSQIVPRSRLQKLNAPMSRFMDCLWQYGVGAKDIHKS